MTLTTLPDNLKPAVEKAAQELFNAKMGGTDDPTLTDMLAAICMEDAEKAVLAFLNAAIEAGDAREAELAQTAGDWYADTIFGGDKPNALILRMGDK
jgi:hypothetical protein